MHRARHIAACILLLIVGDLFGTASVAEAAFSELINYQGKLTTPLGVAVPDGQYNMRFWLLTTPGIATTSALCSETLTGSNRGSVENGLFSVMLGSTTPFTGVDFNQTLYLGVEIGGATTTPSWDGEMSPRKILGAVPAAFVANFAITASSASALGGVASSSFLRSDEADTMTATSSGTLVSFIQNGAGAIARFFSGVTEVFTILGNGNIGVGTSTPTARLAVSGNTLITGTTTLATTTATDLTLATALRATSGGTGLSTITQNQLLIGGAGNTWTQVATSSLGLGNGTFLGLSDTPSAYTANRLFFTNSGGTAVTDSADLVFTGTNLGIGSTSPSARLTVVGNAYIQGNSTTTGSITVGTGRIHASNNSLAGGSFFSGGEGIVASGFGSIAWGNNSASFGSIIASGDGSMALGSGAGIMATNSGSFAFGYGEPDFGGGIISGGIGSFAGGNGTTGGVLASGNGAFAFGGAVAATGNYATAFGRNFTNSAADTFQIGYTSTPIFTANATSIGIGTTSPSSRLTIQGVSGSTADLFRIASSTGSTTLAMLANGNLELPGQFINSGILWMPRTATQLNNWSSVAYGNGLFVAVSINGTNRVMTSPDGITWTARNAVGVNSWNDVAYGNGLFVAVSDGPTNYIMTSPDGITWTARTAPEANSWVSVSYGNGLFVAVSIMAPTAS